MNKQALILITLASLLDTPKSVPVQKATFVMKAWQEDGSEDTHFESWVSTPDRDRQKDIVEPEGFSDVIDTYMANFAPLTSEHNMRALPVGHLCKAALVRNGNILKAAYHPADPAEFQFFPGNGTGVYARGIVTEPGHARALAKGNMGGMSWTGNAEGTPLPGGGTHYTRVTDWLETTLAAYPVNPNAVVVAAH